MTQIVQLDRTPQLKVRTKQLNWIELKDRSEMHHISTSKTAKARRTQFAIKWPVKRNQMLKSINSPSSYLLGYYLWSRDQRQHGRLLWPLFSMFPAPIFHRPQSVNGTLGYRVRKLLRKLLLKEPALRQSAEIAPNPARWTMGDGWWMDAINEMRWDETKWEWRTRDVNSANAWRGDIFAHH